MTRGEELRCPACRHLAGVRRPDGVVEVRKRARLVAVIEVGEAFCDCGTPVRISGRTSKVVFRALGEQHPGEAA